MTFHRVKELQLLNLGVGVVIFDTNTLTKVQMGKIWKGKDGNYYTYIKEGEDRRLVKRKKKEDLEGYVEKYHIEKKVDPTFKQDYLSWVKQKREYKEVKESSLYKYHEDYKRYFKGSDFEKMKIRLIDDLVLDEFIRSRIATKELTSKAYSCMRTLIIGVMKYAKRYHHTDFSISTFFKDFQISKSAFKKPSRKRKYVYRKDEREKLYLHLLKTPTIENLGLALLCLTGLRIGELSALKKEDNVGDCRLFIHRTESKRYIRGKREIFVEDTSKMDHDGEIYIPKAAQRIINQAYMMSHDDEYLFSVRGRRIKSQSFRWYLRKACKEIGIDYRPPHQMRKTYASILLSAGVDEAIIKKEMRHSEISTTRAYYQFITEKEDDEQAIIDKVMNI